MEKISLLKLLQLLTAVSLIIGILFRIANLNWGAPYYFHPDERNLASAVSQLSFPSQMNPHFFAYGSFPLYIIYFTGVFFHLFSIDSFPLKISVSFDEAIIISRLYSCAFSLLSLLLTYTIAKKITNKPIALVATALFSLSTGAMQFAHFGTFEMWLTFFSMVLFYFSFELTKDLSWKNIIFSGIVFGLLVGIKISSLPLILIPLFAIFLLQRNSKFKETSRKTAILLLVTLLTFAVTSPFIFFDYSSFVSSMQYESGVALGTLPVFYTGDFFNSIPILYQFVHIYPFLINPFLTILFIPALCYVTYTGMKQRNPAYFLLFTIYYLLFFSQAFLFAKWTRYIAPTIPFVYLIIGVAFFELTEYLKRIQKLTHYYTSIVVISGIVVSAVFPVSYFFTAYSKPDTRITAAVWTNEHIPKNAQILSEVYDLGILPFNQYFPNITLFNFYDVDNLPTTENQLTALLSSTDYIILPSQRILTSRLSQPQRFPKGNSFYSSLINGTLGFKKVYETSCDLFCKLVYMGNPVFSFEQTATVFDRPTVFIYERIRKS